MKESLFRFFRAMGLLRVLLAALALLLVGLMPWADVTLEPVGIGLLRCAVLPAALPVVFMVVMLDLLMCRVLRVDADEQRRADLNRISVFYVLLGLLMMLSWLPVVFQARSL